MNRTKAIKIAIESMKKSRQILAFNANLYKKNVVRSMRTRKDTEEYDQLTEAIMILKGEA